MRESDFDASLTLRPSRRRRTGSLLGRLRQLREPDQRQRSVGQGSDSSPREHDLLHEPDLSDEALEGWVEAPAEAPAEAPVASQGSDMQRALEIFNDGEHPRRVGGVARSLGAPAVTVRPVEGSPGRFTIVVAWELCWYRYEVDVEDEQTGAQLVEKGMELAELSAEDRAANAAADERGELAIAA